MMRRVSPKMAKKMMKRMGLTLDTLDGVNEVIFRMEDKEMVIENPEVSILKVQGQKIYQVVGEAVERKMEKPTKEIPEEDVQLVAQQSGASLEEARAALIESDGDLAKAILMLTQRGA